MTPHRNQRPSITIDRITQLGNVLGVWAHPDDETYLSGGIMAALRSTGAAVRCITATRGELGGDEDAIEATRARELDDALRILGVDDHMWLGYRDGDCSTSDPEPAIRAITRVLTCMRPDTVLTFDRHGLTGHPDHCAVSRWTSVALARSGVANTTLLHTAVSELQLPVLERLDRRFGVMMDGHRPQVTPADRLTVDVRLSGRLLERKVRALQALGSQTSPLIDHLGLESFSKWVATEHFVAASDEFRPGASFVRAAGEHGSGHSGGHFDTTRPEQEQP